MLCVNRLYCTVFLDGLIDQKITDEHLTKYNREKQLVSQLLDARKYVQSSTSEHSNALNLAAKTTINQMITNAPWYHLLVRKGWEVMEAIQAYLYYRDIPYSVCSEDEIKILIDVANIDVRGLEKHINNLFKSHFSMDTYKSRPCN